ncbi:MAG: Fe-S cluster assembly ATPase SufC [Bacillales bacterium]|jgi:Fe-S cluster assembly ATP-binding protein|nr:Fe-S cluster assembly ATPase SufC [Bacillales bacterium]
MAKLSIKDLHVLVGNKKILNGINLEINDGEVHALLAPNGHGKSTLLAVLMGNPNYIVEKGEVLFNGVDLLKLSVDERAKAGLFLAMQYPMTIPGVSVSDFLKSAINAKSEKPISLYKFIKTLEEACQDVNLPLDMVHRPVNEGFSGGEKKRNEILQMLVLKPSLALLDEIDSGLDVDAIKIVASAVNKLRENPLFSAILVSHYARLFQLITPTHVHIIINGEIIANGDFSLIEKIDKNGYDWIKAEYGVDINKKVLPVSLENCGVKR